MNLRDMGMEKMVLIILVLAVSILVGWYGEKAVERFMHDSTNNNQTQSF